MVLILCAKRSNYNTNSKILSEHPLHAHPIEVYGCFDNRSIIGKKKSISWICPCKVLFGLNIHKNKKKITSLCMYSVDGYNDAIYGNNQYEHIVFRLKSKSVQITSIPIQYTTHRFHFVVESVRHHFALALVCRLYARVHSVYIHDIQTLAQLFYPSCNAAAHMYRMYVLVTSKQRGS